MEYSGFLQNNKIKLRALEPEDLEYLYEWENNTSLWIHSNTLSPYSKYTIKQYIENSHQDIFESKQLRLMVELIDFKIVIGTIDLFDVDFYNSRAGVGILIGNEVYRGKGYAGASLDLLINYAFNKLNLFQLYCNISEDNIHSLQLFKSRNFVVTGKKIAWQKNGKQMNNVFFLQLLSKGLSFNSSDLS